MRHVRKDHRQPGPAEASHHSRSHEHQAVPVHHMQQDFHGQNRTAGAPVATQQRQVRLQGLRQIVHLPEPPGTTHVGARGRGSLHLRGLRQGLQTARLPATTRASSR